MLARFAPLAIISSDSIRAQVTAGALTEACGVPAAPDPRLREMHLGGWQGLSRTEASEQFPAEYAAWIGGDDVRRGGGEIYAEVGTRSAAAVSSALHDVPSGVTLVVVSHGGTSRALLATLLDLPQEHWWRVGPLGNAHWSVLIEATRGWRLTEHNVGAAEDGALI